MNYDLIIIGGGPAGMTAGIYASRAKLSTLILEAKTSTGGQIATTSDIENWPGKITSGPELANDFRQHCEKMGVQFQQGICTQITNISDTEKHLTMDNGSTLIAKTIIIATGATPVTMNVPGEDRLRGKGVAYCATCDGEFFDGLELVTVGSGNTAMEESVFLTRFASKVTIMVRTPEGKFTADKTAFERAKSNPKIQFLWNTSVIEVAGEQLVEGVKIKNNSTGEVSDFVTDGIFPFIGMKPITDFLKGIVGLTDRGYIIANEHMETNIPGIFAAGDVIDKTVRQVITAASDGAIAAMSASHFIEKHS